MLDDMQQLLAASEGPLGALLALREQVSAQGHNTGLLLLHGPLYLLLQVSSYLSFLSRALPPNTAFIKNVIMRVSSALPCGPCCCRNRLV